MKTTITNRKTPHAVLNTVHCTQGTNMVYAWCFEFGDVNDRLVKKLIPITHVYVKADKQDLGDDSFKQADVRKVHVDVWAEQRRNHRAVGKWMTNRQLADHQAQIDDKLTAAENFMALFE